MVPEGQFDAVVVGAGAAGLAAAIFARRERPAAAIAVLDGNPRPGAKILVSGGGRCNVTNIVVSERDFWGGNQSVVRRVLRGFPVADTIAFFEDIGVRLREEPGGKLFPETNRARDVLTALLRAAADAGVRLIAPARVHGIAVGSPGFILATSAGSMTAANVILATGGRSLPKTGSDGGGYGLARAFGHTLVPQTPALAPLVLDPDAPGGMHAELSGVACDVEITVWVADRVSTRLSGALLWTHFGISGPVVLNASRHWARAINDGAPVRLTLNFRGGASFEQEEAAWVRAAAGRPRATVRSVLAGFLPDALAGTLLHALAMPADRVMAAFTREERRRLVHSLLEWPVPVVSTRGYNYAEVTAGGVELTEIDPATMESRLCPGLFLVGEILDVDGRIGGFNFQWAWASARAAARGLARRTPRSANHA